MAKGCDYLSSGDCYRIQVGIDQDQARELAELRARIVWLERVEKAAVRVALAWPYYRELTDYVEFESACNGLRAVLGLTSADEGGAPDA